MYIGNIIGIGNYSRVSPSQIANQIYDSHYARVTADGGVIESEANTKAYLIDLIENYSITSLANFKSKIPVSLNPAIFGYKIGTGVGITLGQAAEKLYSVNESADVSQATLANQPLHLIYNGSDKYYFSPRVSGNEVISTDHGVTYDSAVDTVRFTAKIFMNNQTTTTFDYLFSINAMNFAIANKGTSKQLRIRGSANSTDSSLYAPSTTAPHWIRYTVTTTDITYEWSADGSSWTAIGTVARPTLATFNTTFKLCATAGATANAVNVYYAKFENVTTGGSCTFTANSFNRASHETFWEDVDCSWSVTSSTTTTGLKGVMVDETVCIGDGVAFKLANASLAISQPYTSYASIRRLGTGVIYGLGASSQLSNDATNTTLNNGTALNIANTSKLKQLVTAIANGASSSLQVDNGTATTGDAGANNGTYLEVLGNGASYGNYTFTSLLIVDGN